jgi:hypothetical protein
MEYTGGALNLLNGKMGISAPHRSVPVMKLIRVHVPKSKEELVELIKYHYENNCACGIRSKGTVEDFGRNLFNAQMQFWGSNKFTLQQCIQLEYDLFVVQSLKGGLIEKRAMGELAKVLPTLSFAEANGYVDEEMRIDIIVMKLNVEVAGIQVKPGTFKLMRSSVIEFNTAANSKWGKPVFYLYYDEEGKFMNWEEITKELEAL